MHVLGTIWELIKGLFGIVLWNDLGPFCGCFMAGLWPVLWPNWGLFCALFYGLFVDCFVT